MKGQDTCPQMTLGAQTFFRKCPGTLEGQILDISHVLKCVLKFSRGQARLLPTKQNKRNVLEIIFFLSIKQVTDEEKIYLLPFPTPKYKEICNHIRYESGMNHYIIDFLIIVDLKWCICVIRFELLDNTL